MGESDDQITISRSALRELELSLLEDKKRIDKNLRLLAILRGGLREKPVTTPLRSPTGRRSKCVELAKQSSKLRQTRVGITDPQERERNGKEAKPHHISCR